jgi:hypothetical protein
VYGNVAALFQPSNKHLETVFCELLAKFGGFYVVVAEVAGRVIFEDATSARDEIYRMHKGTSRTAGLCGARVSGEAAQH